MHASRLEAALARLSFSRALVQEYIADLAPEEWFRQPHEGVTHVAWQVGHLALVEYSMLLKRIRGERPEDAELLPVDEFAKRFGKGSTPDPDPQANPSGAELHAALDHVHKKAMAEIADFTDEQLDVPVDAPHSRFNTKLEAVEFCSQHELLHAGQIALLRRLLGRAPLR